jgi:hypothetical protein
MLIDRRPHAAFDSVRGVIHGLRFPFLVFVLVNVLATHPVFAGTFTAQVDRTRIVEGETVTLELSASGVEQGNPDLEPLSADFDIVGQSQGSQINIINGNSSSSREWRLALLPKHGGQLKIPALRLGALRSDPIAIEVTRAETSTSGAASADRPVMIEVETDTEQPYVQGQVIYRVRILSRAPLHEASLSEPNAGDAIVEQLGDDKRYTTRRNGTTYQVVEQRYAVFPQHSGELDIESPMLAAAVPVRGGQGHSLRERFFGGDPFADINKMLGRQPGAGFPDIGGMFEETRPVRLRGRTITLEVQPQPTGVRGAWLPAKNLTLTENWSPDPPVFRVGEPVTRSVTLTAEGLSTAQLPDLTPPAASAFKVYPDQAQNDTRAQGDALIATRTQKAALVPTTAGKVTLPEVTIPWWDTTARKTRVATLPAREVEVLPALAGVNPPEPVAATVPDEAVDISDRLPIIAGSEEHTVTATGTSTTELLTHSGYWPWIATATTVGWLVTLLLWVRNRSHHVAGTNPGFNNSGGPTRRENPAQYRSRLREACLSNDPKAARTALLNWAKARWPDSAPRGLAALARRCTNDNTRDCIMALDRLLYDAAAERSWDGRAAWTVLEHLFDGAQSDEATKTADALPDLYPSHG